MLNHLEDRGHYYCTSYLRNEYHLNELLNHLTSSCGCTVSASTIVCRDLDVAPIKKPIFWNFQPTCKKIASDGCKAWVAELDYAWIKVPTDDDKICADAYKGTKTLAKSCS